MLFPYCALANCVLTEYIRMWRLGFQNGYWFAIWTYLIAGVVALFVAMRLTGLLTDSHASDINVQE